MYTMCECILFAYSDNNVNIMRSVYAGRTEKKKRTLLTFSGARRKGHLGEFSFSFFITLL